MKGYAVYRHDGSVFVTNDIDRAIFEVLDEAALFPEGCYPIVRILR